MLLFLKTEAAGKISTLFSKKYVNNLLISKKILEKMKLCAIIYPGFSTQIKRVLKTIEKDRN
jgi:hypothetical protein